MTKSTGHITFTSDGLVEFYAQDGQVFRAPISNAIDIHGRRAGRWECSEAHFARYRAVIVW